MSDSAIVMGAALRRVPKSETLALAITGIRGMSGKIAGARRAQRQETSLLENEPIDRSRGTVRGAPGAVSLLQRWLDWAVPATPQERGAALWSFAYFFMLLASYYVLRPLRDQMGIAGGVKALPWMFTATFVTLLVMQPLYGALVAKLPRARFIAVVYHFFAANLALFWLLLTLGVAPVVMARVFFVWVSVFSLFTVAVFWSFMADLFDSEQGKRLFGFIGAGGSAGSLLGPVITIGLSVRLGPVNLLIAAIALLELAVFCVHRLERTANARQGPRPEPSRVGGSAFAGLSEFFGSSFLLGVGAWVSLLSFGATILYLQQANIVAATVHGAGAQTRIFASIDLAVGLLTLATQFFATGQLLKRFGAGAAAGALPAVYLLGFAALALTPSLTVVIVIQIAQRWMNFAIANPARQVFYTVVTREEKYKAKNFIDVVIYRGSDAFYGWMFGSLEALGLKIAAIALCALPVAAGWLVLSSALGRAQERRAVREIAVAAPGD
jgi:ATP:ADP antiporter, AAA family